MEFQIRLSDSRNTRFTCALRICPKSLTAHGVCVFARDPLKMLIMDFHGCLTALKGQKFVLRRSELSLELSHTPPRIAAVYYNENRRPENIIYAKMFNLRFEKTKNAAWYESE